MLQWITRSFLRYMRASIRFLVTPRSSASSKEGGLLERRNAEKVPIEQSSRTWKLSNGVQKAENIEIILGWWSAVWIECDVLKWGCTDVEEYWGKFHNPMKIQAGSDSPSWEQVDDFEVVHFYIWRDIQWIPCQTLSALRQRKSWRPC